jgi:RNA recognition motif-containing protein
MSRARRDRTTGDAIRWDRADPARFHVCQPGIGAGRFLERPIRSARRETVSKNLYVGNLAFGTTQADLEQLFGQYGTVTKAQVVVDRETGQSRGFAFVEMASGAEEAIKALNLSQFQGRSITVNEARPREDRPRGGGRGGYGGGGRRY